MQKPPPRALVPATRITKDAISELSGIVASRRFPRVFWCHNDSGDSSRFFAIRADGSFVAEMKVRDAANVDWEDIALEGSTLWLSDLGNNGNKRKDLCVYKLAEPDPSRGDDKVDAQQLPVAYPDQSGFPPTGEWAFDCEAIFVYQGKLHVLTKHRKAGMAFLPSDSTNLYRLDTEHTKKVNTLTKLDSRSGLGGWVTAADLSPDGKTLAVLCHLPLSSIWLFDLRGVGEKLLSKPIKRLVFTGAKQCEALCYADSQTLLMGNEQRELFRIKLSEIPAYTQGT